MSMASLHPAPTGPAAIAVERAEFEQRFSRIRVALLTFYALLVILACATFAYRNAGDRMEVRSQAEASAETLTRALEQHAARIFEAAEQAALDAREFVEERGGAHGIDVRGVRLLSALQAKRSPEIRNIWVLDSRGQRRITAAHEPPIDLSGRPAFAMHRADPRREAHVALPVRSPADGRWIIPVSARIDAPDGTFDGMVVVAIEVEKVVDFYRSLDLDGSAAIMVVGIDLTPYIAYPYTDRMIGQRANLPELEARLKQAPAGLVEFRSPVLHSDRIAAYRKIAGRPFYVAISLDRDQVFAAWWEMLRFKVAMLALVIAALTFFTVMLLHQLRREREATERLHELNAHLEARVSERTAQLQAANEQLESFSYSVSHDLRTPLWHLSSLAEMLKEDYGHELGPEPRRLLERLAERSDYMRKLIDSLLALSGLGRVPLRPASLDLSAMSNELLAELRRAEPDRVVEARVQEGLNAKGDAVLVRTMLQNLIGNAWKYSSRTPGAVIEVGAEPGEGETVYYVRDNGVGFDGAQAQRLFRAFQRLHSETDFPGMGIGLAGARRIVQRHGGRIWTEAAPGRGATFRFTLPGPLQPEAQAPAALSA
jgi:signal transduction histidine kinase